MSIQPTLAVTGATGAVGGLVARALASAGVEQRLLVRSPDRAPSLTGAVVLPMTYVERTASRSALEGVTTLFMVSGAEAANRLDQHRTFIDAAAEAGVQHIVYTSFYGASADSTFTLGRDHFATEHHVREKGLTYTFLRDNFYLDFLPLMVGDDGVIRGPAGKGRVSAVARADVARVAVTVLLNPEAHRDVTYDLTGPEALALDEVAATVTQVTGRKVNFHDETIEEAYASRQKWDAPDWQYDAWVSTYTAIASGEVAGVSNDVARVTGRAPTNLREMLAAG